jgi:hypothetical protein
MNLKSLVEPQRRREHRVKAKHYAEIENYPSGEGRLSFAALNYCVSLRLCVSVVRNVG